MEQSRWEPTAATTSTANGLLNSTDQSPLEFDHANGDWMKNDDAI